MLWLCLEIFTKASPPLILRSKTGLLCLYIFEQFLTLDSTHCNYTINIGCFKTLEDDINSLIKFFIFVIDAYFVLQIN